LNESIDVIFENLRQIHGDSHGLANRQRELVKRQVDQRVNAIKKLARDAADITSTLNASVGTSNQGQLDLTDLYAELERKMADSATGAAVVAFSEIGQQDMDTVWGDDDALFKVKASLHVFFLLSSFFFFLFSFLWSSISKSVAKLELSRT
jgi:hypothetical protein